jgi:signal recognition particle subunit SRP54
MMVGLQGQGKTTTSGKLARLLAKDGKKVLLVAADMQRPAAVEQLQVLGQKVGVPVFALPGANARGGVQARPRGGAGAEEGRGDLRHRGPPRHRHAVDGGARGDQVRDKPQNILLVVNAAIGQNALNTAQAFHDTLGLTGVALTMLDGDARGGAALSIREVTGVPIRFAGTGEAMDRLEPFRPDGMASRILGMGDIVSVVNQFTEVVDQKSAEQQAKQMLEGDFDFDMFVEQINTIQKMGPLQDLFDRLPFFPGGCPRT